MANYRARAYQEPDESQADFRGRQAGYRTGSTREQRAGTAPGYVPGYGVSAPQNNPGSSLTDASAWAKRFPKYNGARQLSPYDPDPGIESDDSTLGGSATAPAASPYIDRLPPGSTGPALGAITPGIASSGFDYTGMQHVRPDSRLEPATPIYDPAHDTRTQRQGNQIISPYGSASVSYKPASDSWQADIIAKYPQIGVAGSEENKAFLDAFNKHGAWEKGMNTAHQVMSGIAPLINAPGAGRSAATDTSQISAPNPNQPTLPNPPPTAGAGMNLEPGTASAQPSGFSMQPYPAEGRTWRPIQGPQQANATPPQQPGYFRGIWDHLVQSPDPGAEAARQTGKYMKDAVKNFRPY